MYNDSFILYGGTETCNIENCTITGNYAGEGGGGIYSQKDSSNAGQLEIKNSKIYGNEAVDGGSDLNTKGTHLRLDEDIEKLISIYAEDDLIPRGWVYDYPTDPIELPTSFDVMAAMLKMDFESPEPEPDPEPSTSPAPTPAPEHDQDTGKTQDPSQDPDQVKDQEPEQTPPPVPDSDREQDRSSWRADPRPAESPSKPQDGTQEQPQITLTNGRAVLTAPDGLYWAGSWPGRGRGNSHKG